MYASRGFNRKTIVLLLIAATGGAFAAEQSAVADKAMHGVEKTHEHAKGSSSDSALIASAMKAAPANVAKNATVVAMEADGKMRTLASGITKSDMFCSAKLGTSGSSLERVGETTPRALSLPALTRGAALVTTSNVICT